MALTFTWDPRKAASNEAKHGVTFEEAKSSFFDPCAVLVEDAVHHERAVHIGYSQVERLLLTVFLDVDEGTVRIISSRRATKGERRLYEQGRP